MGRQHKASGKRRTRSAARGPCLVFDLDDTLFLERDYVRSGFAAVGQWAKRNLGAPDFAESAWRLLEQGHRGRIFDTLLAQSGWDPCPSLVERLVTVYRMHAPRIWPSPDAIECLSRFRAQNDTILALITDGPAASQRHKIRALQLAPYFHVIVLTGVWGDAFSKPHARAFQMIQRRVNPLDRRFIYVGDNPEKDFIAPKALGWGTVRIRRPAGLHSRIDARPGFEADIELPDLAGLDEFVYRSMASVGVTHR